MSKNINKLLKQAQKVQAQMMKAQEDFQKKKSRAVLEVVWWWFLMELTSLFP